VNLLKELENLNEVGGECPEWVSQIENKLRNIQESMHKQKLFIGNTKDSTTASNKMESDTIINEKQIDEYVEQIK
jgi:hypothetical protein